MPLRVITAVIILLSAPMTAHANKDQDVAKIRAAYLEAKKLYKKGDYQKAIQAFSKVREMRYHPILDYRIGLSYEALKRYKLAKAHYRIYVKLYDKGYPVGKNHPKPADVKKRIKKLKKTDPPVTPAPADTPMPTAPAEKASSTADAEPAQYAPYTEPPPPGYENAPPPPPPSGHHQPGHPQRHPMSFPGWGAVYITGDLGGVGVRGDSADNLGYDEGGAGGWVGLFYRPLVYVSGGLVLGGHGLEPNGTDSVGDSLGQLFAGVAVRGHIPFALPWRLDIWGGLSAGYAHSFLQSYGRINGTSVDDVTTEYTGLFVGGSVGMDLYLSPWFSVGALVRLVKPKYNTLIVDGQEFDEDNLPLGAELPEDVVFYGGVSATVHLFFM
jgi:tetratricopeptide (TPR) repeat protein